MKDVFDIKAAVKGIIYPLLSANGISAKIYDVKPDGYKGIYIVVAHVSTTNETLQDSVVYVRVHVPNLVLNISGATDDSQPDNETLERITKVLTPALDNVQAGNYMMYIEWAPNIESEPEMKYHYVAIRLKIEIVN